MYKKFLEQRRARKAAKALYQKDIELAAAAKRLHGVNLDQWHYLGYSKIYITSSDSDNQTAFVYFFVSKKNFDMRHYVIKGQTTNSFKNHQYVLSTAELWKVGETSFYHPVRTRPSNFLQDYMLTNFKNEWDNSSDWSWWVTTEESKYKAAKNQQVAAKKKEDIVKDLLPEPSNVVKLAFPAKEDV